MVYVKSDQDVPPRVMEMLRMFLAASSRGEEALFVLETKKNKMTTQVQDCGNYGWSSSKYLHESYQEGEPSQGQEVQAQAGEVQSVEDREEEAGRNQSGSPDWRPKSWQPSSWRDQ